MTEIVSSAASREPSPWASPRWQVAVAIGVGLSTVAALLGLWKLFAVGAAVSLVLILALVVASSIARGDADSIVIGWVFLYPLGYYLLSYPRDRPIIQFDRILILVLLACIMAAARKRAWNIPADLMRPAIAWLLFIAVTCISFLQGANPLTIGREIVDGLLLPTILGWYVVRQFRLSGHIKWLHVAICIMTLYSAVIGIAEVATHQDLLAFQSGDEYYTYDPNDPMGFIFLRANGPFLANQSYAIVGLISLFLLLFLWPMIREGASRSYRLLHGIACVAAVVEALLPMFRSILITLIVVVIIDAFYQTGIRRKIRLGMVALVPILIAALAIAAPGLLAERSSSSNLVSRLAQDQQTWRMFVDHPVFGVGLFNFMRVAQSNARYQVNGFGNEPPLDVPHNNLGWVAVETGIVGMIPFVASQVLLVVAFRRLSRRGDRGRTAWRFFLYIFLAYWLTGFTETAAEYGELNMWFIFAVALLYRYGIGESRTEVAALVPAPGDAC